MTNNGFLDGIAFDGMRKHLAQDFTKIYHIDLKGNARTSGERRRKEGGNVFNDQIRVGVGITFFIKRTEITSESAEVWLYSVDDYLKATEKQQLLIDFGDYTKILMRQTTIDEKHTWLTEGLHAEFDTFLPIGSKAAKASDTNKVETLFKTYSVGVVTARDAWVYNFNRNVLTENLTQMMEYYNGEVFRWERRRNTDIKVNDFIDSDDTKIKWSRSLKSKLKTGTMAEFSVKNVRASLYRPFTKSHLYFHRMMNECVYVFPSIFPTPDVETENRVICFSGTGSNKPLQVMVAAMIPSHDFLEKTQCFPFYTYNEDGTNR